MPTIVMTGGTSGFGEIALKLMLQSPNTRLISGARREGPPSAETIGLDLTQLVNVHNFTSLVLEKLGNDKINVLVLNAGMQLPNGQVRTADGFEMTFAVNHLAHYLMLRLLLPYLAEGARIVITTSGTHDPAEKTIIPPPRHADAKLLAYPASDPEQDQKPQTAGGRAYSSSKLCNILTARALAMRPEAEARKLTIIAYDPGPTPGTGLVRNTNFAVRVLWHILGTPMFRLLIPAMNSRQSAGETLAGLALGFLSPPAGRIYAALRRGNLTWPVPSELARRDDVAETLWKESAILVGLPE